MPELLTKYPDLALQELKDAHLQCGSGVQPQILIHCPKQNFCSLPTGELCIYGTQDIAKMSQIHPVEILFSPTVILPFIALIVLILCLGILLGIKISGTR